MTKPHRGWWIWVSRAAWAIVDQGLSAGANFVGSILLARWLSPSDFGLYATGFAVFLFAGTLHTAIVTEPMMIFGPSRYERSFFQYVRALVLMHWRGTIIASCAICLPIVVADMFLGRHITAISLALGLAGPCILFSWILRRSFYVVNRPETAALGGLAYLGAMIAGFSILYLKRWLTPGTAFYVMAAASLVVGGSFWVLLDRRSNVAVSKADIVASHWRYGRWSLLSTGLYWFPANWYLCVLAFWQGPDQAARWRAAMNLIMPVLHAHIALTVLVVPFLVRRKNDSRRFHGALALTLFVFVGSGLAYLVLLRAFGPEAMRFLYRSKYSLEGINLWWLGALPIAVAVSLATGGALRALEKTAQLAAAHTAVAIFTVTLGSILVARFGLAGAIYGSVASHALLGACMVPAYFGLRPRTEPAAAVSA
ncbi:MAG TPA: hypothetical protein VH639_22310 [Bryobacteraceae bacterium]|jgi:O-antigen/teichoic acid export membrane protein